MIHSLRKWLNRENHTEREALNSILTRLKQLEQKTDTVSSNVQVVNKLLRAKVRQANKSEYAAATFLELPDNGIPCPICRAGSIKWVSAYPSNVPKFRAAVVLFCDACGSGHVPDGARLIADYYQAEYATSNRKDRGLDPKPYFEDRENLKTAPYFARARHQIGRLTAHGATFGRVLDFGSGPGYFLYESQAREKFAVEPDCFSDKYLDYIGAKKLSGDDDLPEASFDVIVASHVVEHFTDRSLQPTLAGLVKALRPDGLLLIEVPQGGLSFVVLTVRNDPHTLFFTPEGIRTAVRLAGGAVIDAYPRGIEEAAPHPEPIYRPDAADDFATTRRGGLTVIARRAG